MGRWATSLAIARKPLAAREAKGAKAKAEEPKQHMGKGVDTWGSASTVGSEGINRGSARNRRCAAIAGQQTTSQHNARTRKGKEKEDGAKTVERKAEEKEIMAEARVCMSYGRVKDKKRGKI